MDELEKCDSKWNQGSWTTYKPKENGTMDEHGETQQWMKARKQGNG